MKRLLFSVAAAAAISAFGTVAQADVSFEGKTVRIVVPTGSGGTYHLYCQILSRHLGNHLPGKPSVITENRPGAGGVVAARYMVVAAPKDGTAIAMINPGSIALPGLRPNMGFNTLDMSWLGSMSGRAYTIGTITTSGIKTIEDAKKREVIMGTTGKAATSYLIPTFMNETLGTKFKVITGYKSGGSINLAIQKKEVEGRGNFHTGYLGVWPEAVRDNLMTFIARMGPERPDIQNIPRLRDMMKTDLQREMFDILEISFNVGQAFYAPPDVDREALKVLRAAFVATMKDPAIIKETEARSLPLRWQTPDQVQNAIADVMKKPKESFATLARMLGFDKPRKKK